MPRICKVELTIPAWRPLDKFIAHFPKQPLQIFANKPGQNMQCCIELHCLGLDSCSLKKKKKKRILTLRSHKHIFWLTSDARWIYDILTHYCAAMIKLTHSKQAKFRGEIRKFVPISALSVLTLFLNTIFIGHNLFWYCKSKKLIWRNLFLQFTVSINVGDLEFLLKFTWKNIMLVHWP